uniref:DUF3381 domain-containing protein n=1 Tax=Ascaris lumbricoides TaxID=6252 RepID=A0A0M3IE14_ASCLU
MEFTAEFSTIKKCSVELAQLDESCQLIDHWRFGGLVSAQAEVKKSKAKQGKSKTDAKQSKKESEEKAEAGNKDDATAESKAENEVRSEDADHGDNQKEKAPAKLPESIEVIDEPRKFLPETPEEQEAYRNILQGKMRAARDNETVEDAVSDWGAVQKIEGLSFTTF